MNEIQNKCLGILSEIDRICKLSGLKYYIYSGTLLGAVRYGGFIPWDDDIDIVMFRGDYEKFADACDRFLNKDEFELQTIDTDPFASNGWIKLHDKNTAFIDGSRRKGAMEGVNVDIFPIDNAPDNNFILKCRAKIINKLNFCYQYRFMAHDRNVSFKWKLFLFSIGLIPPWNEYKFKKRYEQYIKKYNDVDTKRVVYFSNADYMKKVVPKECFDNVEYLTFEGKNFPAPSDWKTILQIRYGSDYMTPPDIKERISQHSAKIIDLEHSWHEY